MKRKLAVSVALIGIVFYVGVLVYGFYTKQIEAVEDDHKEPHVEWIEFKQGLKRDYNGQANDSD